MVRKQWEWKLNAINLFCQGFFLANCCFALLVIFGVSIPSYCQGDRDCSYRCKIVAWYLFINMVANYFLIIQKSNLSIVTKAKTSPEKNRTPSLLLSPPKSSTPGSYFTSVHVVNNNSSGGSENNNSVANGGGKDAFTYSDPHSSHYTGQSPSLVTHMPHMTAAAHQESQMGAGMVGLAGWMQCRHCDLMTPPRAKHCPLCNYCVLKRDHHCFFAGCCVGFHNQRYFTAFCLQTGLGCLYSIYLLHIHLTQHSDQARALSYIAYFPPAYPVLWLFGYASMTLLGLLTFFLFNLLISITALYYFLIQVFLIVRGQTKFECEKGIRTYKGTVMGNVRSVFGDFFPFNFFIPIPLGNYHSNGINWDDLCNTGKKS